MRSDIILHSGSEPIQANEICHKINKQADNDLQLIELWLHGRSKHTQRAYRKNANDFIFNVQKPLNQILLFEIQQYANQLDVSDLKPSSIHRVLSAIKSLFAFAYQIGYLPFDTARSLRLPPLRNHLSERILEESDVRLMISLERNPRNKAILTTFYAGGLRVSELCGLKWRDLQPRDSGGQITVFGKGGKTRTILLPCVAWDNIMSINGVVLDDSPVFKSRKGGGHLDESMVWRIVRNASVRAGLAEKVSCHWLRHAHASHALDRNAPIHLVQQTLGHASISTTGRYLHARPADSSANYLEM